MQKAAEDLKKKQAEEAAAKKKIIDARVPALEISGLSQGRRCMHIPTTPHPLPTPSDTQYINSSRLITSSYIMNSN